MELEIKDFAERMIKEYNNVLSFKDEMLSPMNSCAVRFGGNVLAFRLILLKNE